MSFVDSSQKLWSEFASIISDEGLSLYDLERLGDGSLRVSVAKNGLEKPTEENTKENADQSLGQGGVTTRDCARVCRRLMTYLSVEGPQFGLPVEPQMEVSSPGVNRKLRLPEHFEDAVGQRVKIVWQQQKEGQPCSETTIGLLEIFKENCLSLIDESSGDRKDVLLNDVRKARVDFPF